MQFTFGLALLLFAALLQRTVVTELQSEARPDLVLLVVLAWSITRGFTEGTIIGIVGGLALDISSAAPFGLHTTLLGCVGALTALGEANLFRGSIPLFVITAALVTVVYYLVMALALMANGLQTYSFTRVIQLVGPSALMNALLMPLVSGLVQRGVRVLGGWRQLDL